jgi:cystathionine beta-lyase
LIQPPVYAHFHNDVLLNGRHLALAPLERSDDGYRLNAATFEAAIRPNTKLFILSHPHNPTGTVWSEDELRTMGEICARHGVLVISDEVHQDLIINPAKRHIPFASLGTQFGIVNLLGMVAAEAAYTHGEPWLEQLLAYLRGNHSHFAEAINSASAKVRVLPADALYLAWMDCRGLDMDAATLEKFMLTQARLWLDKGQKFGLEGHGYMRVNLGCPRSTVDEAIDRLTSAIANLRG